MCGRSLVVVLGTPAEPNHDGDFSRIAKPVKRDDPPR